MPSQTIKALNVNAPGASLAAWLARVHPDLFLAVLKQARAAETSRKIQLKGLRGLADDSFLSSFEPGLESITVDTNSIVPANFVSDATDTGSSWLSSIADGVTSAGSTVGSALGAAGSGAISAVLSGLGSVTNFIGSKAGLTALNGLAQTFAATQAASINSQTTAAVLQAQIARANAQQTAAPITYQGGVPVYVTPTPQGNVYQPLSAQGIANLTPSSVSVFLSQYGLWLGLAVLAIGGYAVMRAR